MKIIAGVDPGFSGAIVLLENDNKIFSLFDMPVITVGKKKELDGALLAGIFRDTVAHAYIEKAQSMPGQGIASTGRYMESYGRIRGICEGLGIPYTLVHPRTWKKVMMPDMPKEKGASIQRVKQLYPDIDLPRKKDHNKCDALLLSLYGLKQELGT